MRIFLVILLLLLAAAGIGHYTLWKQQVEQFDTAITSSLQHMQSAEAADGEQTINFTYDSKSTGGYPMDAVVRYTNPVITIDDAAYDNGYSNASNREMVLNNAALDGEMVVRTSAINSTMAIEMDGDLTLSGAEYGESFAMNATWDGTNQCEITKAGSPLDFVTGDDVLQQPLNSPSDYLNAFKSLDCDVNDLHITSSDSTPLFTLDAQTINITSTQGSKDGFHALGLDYTGKGYVQYFHKQTLLSDVEMILEQTGISPEPILSALNKQDVSWMKAPAETPSDIMLSGTYDGAIDGSSDDTSFTLDIDTMAIDSNFATMSMPIRVVIDDQGIVDVTHEGSFTATKAAYDAYIKLLDTARDVIDDPHVIAQGELKKINADVIVAQLRDLVPEFHTLGTIRSYANLNAPVSNPNAKIDLRDVGFSTDLHGLRVKGKINPTVMQGDVNIVCTHCPALLTDLGAQANSIAAIGVAMGELPPQYRLTDAAIKAIISFIGSYDTDEDDSTTTITLKDDPASGQLLVSGKPAGMVMMNALGTLGPHFQAFMPQMPH